MYGDSDEEDDFANSPSEPPAPPRHQQTGMEEAATAYEARRAARPVTPPLDCDAREAACGNVTEEKPRSPLSNLPACFAGSDDEDSEEEEEESYDTAGLVEGHATVADFQDTSRGMISHVPASYKGDEPSRGTSGPTWGLGEEVEPGQRKVIFDPRCLQDPVLCCPRDTACTTLSFASLHPSTHPH